MDVMERMNLEFFYKLKNDCAMSVIEFCMNVGLISRELKCPLCRKKMSLRPRNDIRDKYEWVCRVNVAPSHRVKRSVRYGSWFARSKLTIPEILIMTYLLVNQVEHRFIIKELNVSSSTVTDWHCYVREVYVDVCLRMNDPIGGHGVIVDIEESKFGRRKYNRETIGKDEWIFGGVERGTGRMFFKVVKTRDKDALLNILKTFVLPGTTIYSDCWKSYDCLEDEGFKHLSVHHSLHFKNPETGVHTNTNEGTWLAIRRSLPSRTISDQFDSYFAEYVWKRVYADTADSTKTFFEAAAITYKPSPLDIQEKEKDEAGSYLSEASSTYAATRNATSTNTTTDSRSNN